MSVDLGFSKKNRIKKITKKMFEWKKTKVCDGVFVCEKRYHLKKPVLESLGPPPLESMLQWIRDPR